jgi:hypothetical protein
MPRKLACLGALVVMLSVAPAGSVAFACDPNNPEPCDIQPQELPPFWCKLSPNC